MSQNTDVATFLPVYSTVPDEWEDAKGMLAEALRLISETVNTKDSGYMIQQEILSASQFYKGAGETLRPIFRKVINFGSLPNATTKEIEHKIETNGSTISDKFTLVNMYLSATKGTITGDPDPIAFSLQYYSLDAGADIVLYLTDTNVVVKTLTDYSLYTRSSIVLEYLKEV